MCLNLCNLNNQAFYHCNKDMILLCYQNKCLLYNYTNLQLGQDRNFFRKCICCNNFNLNIQYILLKNTNSKCCCIGNILTHTHIYHLKDFSAIFLSYHIFNSALSLYIRYNFDVGRKIDTIYFNLRI